MKTIDRETVQRILDTANIVEVVSDFVHLRRRGANYIGLCPFHSERTPSFSVSPSRGICKCFSCGKGGSPVNFIMEHEQLTYWEALRWLANKYHIEIQEHDITDDERREMNDRQGMMAANDFAMAHFEHNMQDTADGREIGLAYFRERGINDWAIKRFHLGYSLDKRNDLLNAAKEAGLNEKYLVDTGLCIRTDRGDLYDRFKARVMYPVFTISGKVVAFGGRTLRKDKEVAKYVNSPESLIYSKSRELYGLYQAKQAIVKKDKCILVEGYMDVISMHQQGVENVVASSGTSLTQGQIRLIHRFTENVTVIYDSDPAGIKASLRGIDLLLAEGLNIKVLLLPDGDDPDSFAQTHTSEQVEEYLQQNEVDFIKFKMDILLKDCDNDPVKRSKVLGSILQSIANIPVELTRSFYVKECALRFGIQEAVLLRQLKADIAKVRENAAKNEQRREAIASIGDAADGNADAHADGDTTVSAENGKEQQPDSVSGDAHEASTHASVLEPQERALLRLVVKYGMLPFCDAQDGEEGASINVLEYVREDLEVDNMSFSNPVFARIYAAAQALYDEEWSSAYAVHYEQALMRRTQTEQEGRALLQKTAKTTEEINTGEIKLKEKCDAQFAADLQEFALNFFVRNLISHPDDEMRKVVTDLVAEKHQLSKIYYKTTKIETDVDRLGDLVPRALIALKYDMARCYAEDVRTRINDLQKSPGGYDLQEVLKLMEQQKKWQEFCARLATSIGERVYEPLR